MLHLLTEEINLLIHLLRTILDEFIKIVWTDWKKIESTTPYVFLLAQFQRPRFPRKDNCSLRRSPTHIMILLDSSNGHTLALFWPWISHSHFHQRHLPHILREQPFRVSCRALDGDYRIQKKQSDPSPELSLQHPKCKPASQLNLLMSAMDVPAASMGLVRLELTLVPKIRLCTQMPETECKQQFERQANWYFTAFIITRIHGIPKKN